VLHKVLFMYQCNDDVSFLKSNHSLYCPFFRSLYSVYITSTIGIPLCLKIRKRTRRRKLEIKKRQSNMVGLETAVISLHT